MEKRKFIEDLVIQNARLIHKNFEGRPGQYNRQGDKGFSVVIDPSAVDELTKEGWGIRELPPRADIEGSTSLFFIPVRVNFDGPRQPDVFLATRNGLVRLDKETISTLDHADITNVDLTIHAHPWENNGKSGVKAYLRNLYVTIREDPLATKYEQMYAQQPAEEQ